MDVAERAAYRNDRGERDGDASGGGVVGDGDDCNTNVNVSVNIGAATGGRQ